MDRMDEGSSYKWKQLQNKFWQGRRGLVRGSRANMSSKARSTCSVDRSTPTTRTKRQLGQHYIPFLAQQIDNEICPVYTETLTSVVQGSILIAKNWHIPNILSTAALQKIRYYFIRGELGLPCSLWI